MNVDPVLLTADRLREASRVAVLTGAGISAESGVPTFRGPGGLWEGHKPEELASEDAFRRDPELVWRFYDWRRTKLAGCEPNAGHRALATLEPRYGSFTLATQNVDGLHREAGSRAVTELHGNIWRLRCYAGCGFDEIDRRAPMPPPLPPRCRCGSWLRPGVVWFGEALPTGAFERAMEAAQTADVFLVVGTSAFVEPAASLGRLAKHAGAFLVEINPEATRLSNVADATLRSGSGPALGAVLDALDDAS